MTPDSLNRVIWTAWLQGLEAAPSIVRTCVDTWRERNSGWRVVVLSDANLTDYVDHSTVRSWSSLDLPRRKRANLLRLYLLQRYGGVWADATCFCRRPLDDWLPDVMSSGFFALRFEADRWLLETDRGLLRAVMGRSGHKIMANFFLAASAGNRLVHALYEAQMQFFSTHRFPLQGTTRGFKRKKRVERVLRRNALTAQLWTTSLVARATKVYPHNIFHYHFARLVTNDEACREIWTNTPTVRANEVLGLKRFLLEPLTEAQKQKVRDGEEPFFKLSWRYGQDETFKEALLQYLLESSPA